jgi:galactose oxidase-like protein/Kelch motif protein
MTRVVAAALALALLSTSAMAQGAGQWTSMPPLPFFPTAMHVLPNGKVMFYGGDVQGTPPGAPAKSIMSWDPASGQTRALAPPGYDLFCAGHSYLANGKLLLTGGHILNFVGLANASLYDPFADRWTAVPKMNAGRWYPTNTTLANGDVLVLSGQIDTSRGVDALPQIFTAATNTWRNLTSAQLALDLYPRMHLAPNGKVFNSGPSGATRYLDTSGTGRWTFVATRHAGTRDYGSAVMYDPGKILFVGGGDPPTSAAEVIDLTAAAPAWRAVASMSRARRHLNATLLPDGKVLVTGGTSGAGFNNKNSPVFLAEMWDPLTERWTPLASQRVGRFYHSVALLLPDGRVMSAGGNGHPEVEVFSPPYLSAGERPTISGAPASVAYGQTFAVQTPDAASISRVTWIRLPSVTHAFDQNQRINRLAFTAAAGGLAVTAPSNANLAPPGHYMLFLLNSRGVPSIARIVHLGGGGATPPPPAPPPPPSTGSLTVAITSPKSGATVSGTQWVTLWVDGASGTSNTFTISAAGRAMATTTTSSRGPVTLAWVTGSVTDGSQTLTGSVRDAAGHTGASSLSVTVRNGTISTPPPTPPPPASGTLQLHATQPANGATVRGTVWVVLWLEGASPGSNTYTLTVNDQPVATQTTSSTGPVSVPWVTSSAQNGTRTIRATARDAAGHTGTTSVAVTVAN